jgi:VanZ family protein
MERTRIPRWRGTRVVAATTAVVTVVVLTLGPGAFVGPARGELAALAGRVPNALPAVVEFGYAEQLLNVLLFVPLGATLALLLGRRMWPWVIAACSALSIAVELLQRSIAGRVPDLGDVLWNTVGAAIGVLAVTLIRAALRLRVRGGVSRAPAVRRPAGR